MQLSEAVLVRMSPELLHRLGVERRRRGLRTRPETARVLLDELLPAAPPLADPNQTELVPVDVETCEWFAMCANPATGHAMHPVVGELAICDRCATKLGIEVTA